VLLPQPAKPRGALRWARPGWMNDGIPIGDDGSLRWRSGIGSQDPTTPLISTLSKVILTAGLQTHWPPGTYRAPSSFILPSQWDRKPGWRTTGPTPWCI